MANPSYSNPVALQLPMQPATPATGDFAHTYEDIWQLTNAVREIMRYISSVASGFSWGSISGDISAQTDLMAALNAKLSDAPVDGQTYGRQDATWVPVGGGGGGALKFPFFQSGQVASPINLIGTTQLRFFQSGGVPSNINLIT